MALYGKQHAGSIDSSLTSRSSPNINIYHTDLVYSGVSTFVVALDNTIIGKL